MACRASMRQGRFDQRLRGDDTIATRSAIGVVAQNALSCRDPREETVPQLFSRSLRPRAFNKSTAACSQPTEWESGPEQIRATGIEPLFAATCHTFGGCLPAGAPGCGVDEGTGGIPVPPRAALQLSQRGSPKSPRRASGRRLDLASRALCVGAKESVRFPYLSSRTRFSTSWLASRRDARRAAMGHR